MREWGRMKDVFSMGIGQFVISVNKQYFARHTSQHHGVSRSAAHKTATYNTDFHGSLFN
jgi:hypothetical protein